MNLLIIYVYNSRLFYRRIFCADGNQYRVADNFNAGSLKVHLDKVVTLTLRAQVVQQIAVDGQNIDIIPELHESQASSSALTEQKIEDDAPPKNVLKVRKRLMITDDSSDDEIIEKEGFDHKDSSSDEDGTAAELRKRKGRVSYKHNQRPNHNLKPIDENADEDAVENAPDSVVAGTPKKGKRSKKSK